MCSRARKCPRRRRDSSRGNALVVISEVLAEQRHAAAVRGILGHGELEIDRAVVIDVQVIDGGIGNLARRIDEGTVLIDDQGL